MFFGDNVGHTIHRLTHTDKYDILYRPHGSCFDHYIRHLVSEYTDKFFISNKVIVDKAINLIDSYSLEQLLDTRLCIPYNFQLCSSVNKNLEATLTNHLPLVYLVHTKEDLIDIENNILGRYPYIIFIANKNLYDLAQQLDIDKDRLFYHSFFVQNNLYNNIDINAEKSIDVSIFLGGQDIDQVQNIVKKLEAIKLTVNIHNNNFSSKALSHLFESSKVIVELNPNNIYNVIYSINCGTPAIIYNKDHTGNQGYVYVNFDDMVDKIKGFINNKTNLPTIGFIEEGSTPVKEILTNINNRGLII